MFNARVALPLCITWLLLSCTTCAFAVPIKTELNKRSITISAGEWPPFLSESLPFEGVVAHLIKDIFSEAGIQANFTFLPWGRAYHDTYNGKYAATAVWMFSKDRVKNYNYSDAVLREKFVFFYKKDNHFEWHNFHDLRGLIIGGGLNYSYGPEFDKAVAEDIFDLSQVSSTEQNFRRLSAGRIDAFAQEINIGYHILNNQLPELAEAITHHPQPILLNNSFLLFPNNAEQSSELLKIFNLHLQQFKQDGRYQAYFKGLEQGDYHPIKP
ncbi:MULTISPECIES: substrate-binding periplasmic protein [Pseudoalteromonas]|uniref:Transporter substrate-binding domain-containing protein n=1 Tax=Pseudoalteromonas haloplanktis TaxID=228 RepID=A0ABU1B9R7_PSEHA|nr:MULTISPECIES: transporter substrate-binding domain-containing protein [Pseudoalteromonas]MCF6143721.1 polar amino acid transport system substrate-binding protein [Pseudoalteromonas mariniglutinosa NCIMB 1770]MDQ9091105.1 transporter substrate-binding domain-containing protein [Pseudoalteromonas haloplanktis]TMN74819.1 ABC transporter substrate-binding protein [Pseudoalteromonas sp. S1727]BDF93514.1 ABC transporter substrate-binding protein [Pseudoalteromonas sp. KAN5]